MQLEFTFPHDSQQKIPYGYCQCGCGQRTKIAPQSSTRLGWVNGEPIRYITGHHFRHPPYVSLADAFWKYCVKSNPESCWIWQGYIGANGYGAFRYRSKGYLAHRVSYQIHLGDIPKGMEVCHNCPNGDNRACCNPSHFFLGTQADNMHDCHDKERHAHGERMGSAKLTESDVQDIRYLHSLGMFQREIAERFNVQKTTIWAVLNGKTWKHVK